VIINRPSLFEDLSSIDTIRTNDTAGVQGDFNARLFPPANWSYKSIGFLEL
jgi:hypothetical protein